MQRMGPFDSQQFSKLNGLISQCNATELAWLSGYLWARAEHVCKQAQLSLSNQANEDVLPRATPSKITLISASQTGNARRIAEELSRDLERLGLEVSHIHAGHYKFKQIEQESVLILVVSTQGEGEPPEEALAFYKFLCSKKAPQLPQLQIAVFGLGDRSYVNFCQAAKDFEARLIALGAQPILSRVDADIDYQEAATQWRQALVKALPKNTQPMKAAGFPDVVVESPLYTKETPFLAAVNVNQRITGRSSAKDVRHIELDLSGSAIRYQPGDALGVWYKNCEVLVDEVLSYLKLDAQTPVELNGQNLSLKTALTEKFELTQNNPQLVQHYVKASENSALQALIANTQALRHFCSRTPIVDMLRQFPGALTAQDLIGLLRPLTPRLYSIASAQDEVGEEVHLCVGLVEYAIDGRSRFGGASSYLAKALAPEDMASVFIEPNDSFRLPADNYVPIICIAAGTGIAPFRAFMQQRACSQAQGKNWLIFGNPHFTSDFLYQLEWQSYVKDGLLHQIDLAWSRDREQKVYVHHKIRQHAALFWQWLQEGAHIYVCGDAQKMAKDVEQSILQLIEEQANMNVEQAEEYMNQLRIEKRYQRDIY